LKATATIEGDEVIFNGQKMYCTLGAISPYIMLMTRDTAIENPYEGISMWLLPTDTPGVRFSKIAKVGWWSIPTYEVYIQDACASILPDRGDEQRLAAVDGQLRDRAIGFVRGLSGRCGRRI
jgi:alkylation response protein AidB-like acyl-CoA dehydrogenase